MLPLFSVLHITVNELLTGEKIAETDYPKQAEENMMNLMKENKENKKRMAMSVICGIITIIAVVSLVSSRRIWKCRRQRESVFSFWQSSRREPASSRRLCLK